MVNRVLVAFVFASALLIGPRGALAHPAPFSFLDLVIRQDVIDATLVLHVVDVAHDLGIESADRLLDPAEAARIRDRVVALIQSRLKIRTDGSPMFQWLDLEPLPDRHAVVLRFRIAGPRPGALRIQSHMFPYDPVHQTFINIYEDSDLRQQMIFNAESGEYTYYTGSTQGALAVMQTFIPAGVHHILIGPDHILASGALPPGSKSTSQSFQFSPISAIQGRFRRDPDALRDRAIIHMRGMAKDLML